MRKKWSYINDFKMTADGTYAYMGDWYSLENKGSFRRVYAVTGALVTVCALLVVGSGLINAAGMNNTFYVIIPYICEVCCAFALVWKSVRVISSGERVKAYVYTTAVESIPLAATALAVFSAAAFTGSTVYLILHGFGGKMLLSILYLVLKILSAFAAIYLRLYCDRQKWIKLN
jgi:hypothetical protein